MTKRVYLFVVRAHAMRIAYAIYIHLKVVCSMDHNSCVTLLSWSTSSCAAASGGSAQDWRPSTNRWPTPILYMCAWAIHKRAFIQFLIHFRIEWGVTSTSLIVYMTTPFPNALWRTHRYDNCNLTWNYKIVIIWKFHYEQSKNKNKQQNKNVVRKRFKSIQFAWGVVRVACARHVLSF